MLCLTLTPAWLYSLIGLVDMIGKGFVVLVTSYNDNGFVVELLAIFDSEKHSMQHPDEAIYVYRCHNR